MRHIETEFLNTSQQACRLWCPNPPQYLSPIAINEEQNSVNTRIAGSAASYQPVLHLRYLGKRKDMCRPPAAETYPRYFRNSQLRSIAVEFFAGREQTSNAQEQRAAQAAKIDKSAQHRSDEIFGNGVVMANCPPPAVAVKAIMGTKNHVVRHRYRRDGHYDTP